mgnify:CR=1 FL=1
MWYRLAQDQNEIQVLINFFLNKYPEITLRINEYDNKINPSKNCLMIPVLEYLDNINNDTDKPTKFITIVHVRTDNKLCDQTFETLDFAKKIKSS